MRKIFVWFLCRDARVVRGDAEFPEQGDQAGREQQGVDVAAMLVFSDRDGEQGHRGLREPAVILFPTCREDENINITCVGRDALIMSYEGRLVFIPDMEKKLTGANVSKILIISRPCGLQKKENNQAPLA